MNLREAILKAADHIEANPNLFDYWNGRVPECGSPGCALGWAGHFSGASHIGWSVDCVSEKLFGIAQETFYERMGNLCIGWMFGPALCAKTLRAYADKFHPEPETLPNITAELNRIFGKVRMAA